MNIERIGIWVRVSPSKDEGDSPEHHLHRAQAYASSRGWAVTETYMLESVSGKTVHEHPEMLRMLSDIRYGRVHGLIFSSLSRLARKKSTLWQIMDLFKETGAALVCLDLNLDTATPSGELLYGILSAVVEWEGHQISDRVAASVPVRAKMGKSTGGTAVYGYHWVDGQLVPNPEEVPVRIMIYELYREHQRLATVAKILNDRGYKARRGGLWTDMAIRKLIIDTTAKGLRKANYTTRRRSKTRKTYSQPKPESEWVWVPVEAIVDEELWNECQQIYTGRAELRAKRSRNTFSGLLVCGSCNQKMYSDGTRADRKKYRCRGCRASIHSATIEQAFSQRVWAFFGDASTHMLYTSRARSELKRQEELQSKLHRESAKITTDLARAEQDYLSGALTARRFESIASGMENKRHAIEMEATRVKGVIDALNAEVLASDVLAQELQGIPIKWDAFTEDERHRFVREIVERMEFLAGELVIDLVYPSSGVLKEIR